ncbi:MAG: ABC transporter permease, partial [Acetobacteraceae bacterium]
MSEAIAAEAAARKERLAALAGSPALLAGAILVGGWTFCALFGPLIVPFDPYATDVLNELAPPSLVHWFGTDQLGRDVFSRTIVGARDILAVAPLATLLGTVLGT